MRERERERREREREERERERGDERERERTFADYCIFVGIWRMDVKNQISSILLYTSKALCQETHVIL